MAKITKRSVDAAAPGDKEFFIWDEELKGFGLRVYPSGRKMYEALAKLQSISGRRVSPYRLPVRFGLTKALMVHSREVFPRSGFERA